MIYLIILDKIEEEEYRIDESKSITIGTLLESNYIFF
jgi:hypothetical protein